MGEKVISLILAVGVLAAGGYAVVRTMHHKKTVAPAAQQQMVAAVLRKQPGAAVMSTSCGGSSCTIYVRKGATHSCDGWMAEIGGDGQVLLTGVGKKHC